MPTTEAGTEQNLNNNIIFKKIINKYIFLLENTTNYVTLSTAKN